MGDRYAMPCLDGWLATTRALASIVDFYPVAIGILQEYLLYPFAADLGLGFCAASEIGPLDPFRIEPGNKSSQVWDRERKVIPLGIADRRGPTTDDVQHRAVAQHQPSSKVYRRWDLPESKDVSIEGTASFSVPHIDRNMIKCCGVSHRRLGPKGHGSRHSDVDRKTQKQSHARLRLLVVPCVEPVGNVR